MPNGIFFADLRSKSTCTKLSIIFNFALDLGYAPAAWREASLVLIPKKGDLSRAANRCPIVALQDCGYKVFAWILAERVLR